LAAVVQPPACRREAEVVEVELAEAVELELEPQLEPARTEN
jgi:hypothetical protein